MQLLLEKNPYKYLVYNINNLKVTELYAYLYKAKAFLHYKYQLSFNTFSFLRMKNKTEMEITEMIKKQLRKKRKLDGIKF